MEPARPRAKIIQKKRQKKERYAKLVRSRQRKHQTVVQANFEPLNAPPTVEEIPEQEKLKLDFYTGGRDGKADTVMSMLNQSYHTNMINVSSEEDKILSVNLNKKTPMMNMLFNESQFNKDLGKIQDAGFLRLINRMKNFTNAYREIVEENQEKFTSGKIDSQSVKKYNEHQAKLKELRRYKPCIEIVKSFDLESFTFNKISYNNKFISKLHYEFDEYIDRILKHGLQRLRHSKTENGGVFGAMMDNFKRIFEKPLYLPPREVTFFRKDGSLQKCVVNNILAGHFVKKSAEISLFFSMDAFEIIPMQISNTNSLALMPTSPSQSTNSNNSNNEERIQFLMKYYPMLYLEMCSRWQINREDFSTGPPSIKSEMQEESEGEPGTPATPATGVKTEYIGDY